MVDLTSRQIHILRAVIEEYLQTAVPVGSDTLDKKYNLGVSPATIRAEMSYLSDQGYLKQPHTSAGRIPTPIALKLYVRELMNKQDLSVADEVSLKEQVWDSKNNMEALLQESTKIVANRLQSIGIAFSDEHKAYHAGYAYLLNTPEFYDVDVARTVLTLIEEVAQLERIFSRSWGEGVVHMLFGDDLGNRNLEPVSIIFTDFSCNNHQYSLGVIGSSRMNYAYAVPVLEYMHDLILDLVEE
jgi:transcriptional regulator of heat shock response